MTIDKPARISPFEKLNVKNRVKIIPIDVNVIVGGRLFKIVFTEKFFLKEKLNNGKCKVIVSS